MSALFKSVFSFLAFLLLAGSVFGQSYPVGDLDEDMDVDVFDLIIFADQWLDPVCEAIGCAADLDMAEGVNLSDLGVFAAHWHERTDSLVISEFMADNGSQAPLDSTEILDEDGQSSDWIEIHNPTEVTINLGGWYLTDDAGHSDLWRFPDGLELASSGFLIVFASGKDRAVLGGELHTDFRLDAENGDYLALLRDDAETVVDEFAPRFPRQLPNVSFGLKQYSRTLVPQSAATAYHVPASGDAAEDWTQVAYDDSQWQRKSGGLKFWSGGQLQVAYNDLVYEDGQHIADNVTTYGTGNNCPWPASGLLIDQATGEQMSVTVELTTNGTRWQPTPVNGGSDTAPGTDAHSTFADMVDMTGVIYYGSAAGWWVDATFTGLDPTTEYTFATSACRGKYDGRMTLYTISGADTYINASTTGAEVVAEDQVKFNTGNNFSEGYVARWTGITAADGTFKVRAEAAPDNPSAHKAYSFDVFRLQGGYGGSELMEQMVDLNASVWTRTEFDLSEEESDMYDSLTLRMKYEDGFIAYLNGQEVARGNVSGLGTWNSAADGNRPDALSSTYVSYDISDKIALLRDGRNVLAIHAMNDDASNDKFMILPELSASSSLGVPQYFTQPTPGTFNVPGAIDIVADTKFSTDRGFYDSPFTVEITCDTEAAVIHYTTDGSAPSETSGQEYASPIQINTTTTLRAMAFKAGWISSNVDTHSYIFLNDVLNQSDQPVGFPSGCEMDPDIVAPNAAVIIDDLKSLPVMSVVTDVSNLWGAGGIYTNWNSQGAAWEKPCSLELIDPNGTGGFQLNCGIRVYGGVGRREQKKSLRLLFKGIYGPTKLRYPLMGEWGPDYFDTIILRANFNDGYPWGGAASQFIRDEWMRRTQQLMGYPAATGTFVHLYINGIYWGMYNPTQRPDTAFSATHYGGDKDLWDGINSGQPVGESQTAAWNTLMSMSNSDLSTNTGYQKLQGNNPNGTNNPLYEDYLDIDQYINFLLVNFYGGNNDWASHNWYAGRLRGPESTGWKGYTWDAEWVIGMRSGVNENSVNDTPTNNWLNKPYTYLRGNEEFNLRFADHVHRAFFNGGPLHVDGANTDWDPANPDRNKPAKLYADLADMIEPAMICETARWGDVGGSQYTIAHWSSQRNWVLHTYMPQRSGVVLGQLKAAGLYPPVDAPVFKVDGSQQVNSYVSAGSQVTMDPSAGTIYYTTDGSDPRVPAGQSTPGGAVTILAEDATKYYLVPTGPVTGDTVPGTILYEWWSGIDGISVGDLTGHADYPDSPTGSSDLTTFEAPTDWAENFGARIVGYLHPPQTGDYTFWIASDDGGELRLSTDWMSGNATAVCRVSGWTPARAWDNNAEQKSQPITLQAGRKYYIEGLMKERGGGDNLSVAWQGPGIPSRVIIDAQYLSPAAAEWTGVSFDHSTWDSAAGVIGYERSPGDAVNYSDLIDVDIASDMRLVNTTCLVRIPFTVGNEEYSNLFMKVRYDDGFIAYLNGAEVLRVNFPQGTPADWNVAASAEHDDTAAREFETFDISDHVYKLRPGSNTLAVHALNTGANDDDFLISVELEGYETSQGDVSPTAIEYTSPITLDHSMNVKARTLDGVWSAMNESVYAVGDIVNNLRITEIMYHPADPNTEFIELQNIGTEPINLSLAKFTNGVDFTFPSVTVAAGEYVLVVENLVDFAGRYDTAGLTIGGEYTGKLANGGEKIELVDALGETILDFRYRDGWYDITDGGGFSLTVSDAANTDVLLWGDRDTWKASTRAGGSPGEADTGPSPNDVVINEVLAHSDIEVYDWIELYNRTDSEINIGGWYISDNGDNEPNLMKYRIAEGSTIPTNGYIVFKEDEHFGSNSTDPGSLIGFALSENGETVYLTSAEGNTLTGLRISRTFGASLPDIAFGEHVKSTGGTDFVAMSENSPGGPNKYPQVGPVVISEIMYHPTVNGHAEYVELLNISGGEVKLYDPQTGEPWSFTDEGGIEYYVKDPVTMNFITMAIGERLLLVKDRNSFESEFTAEPGTQIFEWATGPVGNRGSLSNGGERIEISMPGDVDADGVRQYIRVDRINYDDNNGWPTEADGNGSSLHRINDQSYGNDPSNWQAQTTTPGGAG